MEIVLKQRVVEKIFNDSALFAKVADVLGVRAATLPQILYANKPKLTQASVLKVLREHLKVKQDSELLCELETA